MLLMLRLDDVRARIEARVPGLAGNLGNAAQFAQLVERKQLPQWRAGGYVLPGQLAGGAASAMTGAFIQGFSETIAVVLVARVQSDPTGSRAMDEITPLVRDVVEAVCGWGPGDSPGVFTLAGGELVGVEGGALIFQLDFTLSDQLRILS